jgi:hypothetical protein
MTGAWVTKRLSEVTRLWVPTFSIGRLFDMRVLALALLCIPNLAVAADHELVSPDSLEWKPMPLNWLVGKIPAGAPPVPRAEYAVIHGDPNKAGPFIIRLKSPPNSILPVHWHKIDEHITVLSGIWCIGQSDKIDPATCKDMPAGSYIFIPRRMHHWAITKNSIVELHAVGPFRAYLVP